MNTPAILTTAFRVTLHTVAVGASLALVAGVLTGLLYALLRGGLASQRYIDNLLPDGPRCLAVEVSLVRACLLAIAHLILLFPPLFALLLAMFGFLPVRSSRERWLALVFVVALPSSVSATIEFDSQLLTLSVVLVIYLAAILLARSTFPAAVDGHLNRRNLSNP